ncbi:ABC transporter permease [Salisediminibacterium halotolerans]|uniref:ABC transporter permease n=1 Tax=Salisediminibacterium halotolerans TaxID=517425 RepID=UPI000EB37188|nr:ABC transporter permease [Salisediminibacterium halotolerans]RLJ75604.1 lipopolysaccharide transport system permease protein/teichoic acid transport system permease protein [Actinophytocola xinjiangensis]RPE89458.1 lipopolysaccharide transport system permease protein/teichoic acid transport system permease protein [Salisediminibacterium halotolerans]TWG36217.1 lipopolysaccharide transport system permease protein/teichoic acid transport system permease protein [Salisediminibacterium halotolera
MRTYLLEIFKRKDLLFYLVRSGLKAEHRNSFLGYFWWLLDPLLNVVIYYFLVSTILGRGGENFAVFLVIGLVAWRWISTTINTSSKSILKYSSIINQVYMPKSMFPLAFTFTQLFNFGFGIIVVAIFLVVYGIMPGWEVIFLPLIIIVQLILLIAVSFILAYVTIFIRDMEHLLSHVTRVFFYSSPIIWEGGRLPDEYQWVVEINPVAIIIESYRDILMYQQMPNFTGLFVITVVSALVLFGMLKYYSNNEHKIIKAL